MIIDDRIRELVRRIDEAKEMTPDLDATIAKLVARLKVNCASQEVRFRQHSYGLCDIMLCETEPIALDQEGYAPSFDPLQQEKEFVEFWQWYGLVISKNVVAPELRQRAIARVYDLAATISGGRCDLHKPETWSAMPVDSAGVPLLSRGFFEIYHDDVLAALRQSVRVYLHFVLIWGRPDLWTTFDRLGVKLPGHGESKALPLHVDQNPNIHPKFRTVQGVLALTDCPAERGTFVAVPGSKRLFNSYLGMARNDGEYVELDLTNRLAPPISSGAQAFPMRAGDLVSWDSRTTHANSANISNDPRLVAYISAGVAREQDAAAVLAREEGFKSGLGSNERDAYMHASMRPRYTDPAAVSAVRALEQLTLLGRLIYGKQSYGDIAASSAS